MANRYEHATLAEIELALDRGDESAADAWLDRVGSWPSDDPDTRRVTQKAERLRRRMPP